MAKIPTSYRGRKATGCGVSECDGEALIMRRSWPTCGGCCVIWGWGIAELWSEVNGWKIRITFNIVSYIKWRTTTYRHMLRCTGKETYSVRFTVTITRLWRHRCLDRRITFRWILPLYSPVVTICSAGLTFNNSTFCPHSEFMSSVWIWEQTAIISLYSINWLVCITKM